ncbi:MAG: haloacid dehalogenase-like hydrolase [Eubacteriaceae bacterium]|nr:haloacid dehalogenase-like hydrolase [Eubacteriaceae bacterium]
MNIYDFDKTIYAGNSSVDFFLYCFKRKPNPLLFIRAVGASVSFLLTRDKEKYKTRLFMFMKDYNDPDELLSAFWDVHLGKIYDWYLAQRSDDDIIISAAPEFILAEVSRRLGFLLIATPSDKETGRITGNNCYGSEKYRRLVDETGITSCEEFYSDHKSDLPLAKIAKRAFLVTKGNLTEWK